MFFAQVSFFLKWAWAEEDEGYSQRGGGGVIATRIHQTHEFGSGQTVGRQLQYHQNEPKFTAT